MTTSNLNRMETSVESESKSLAEIIESFINGFKKFWWVSVCLMVIAGAVGYFRYKRSYVPIYQSEATFSITAPETNGPEPGFDNNNSELASTLSVSFDYLINNEVFYEIIKEDIGMSFVPSSITISAVEDTNILSIKTSGGNPEMNLKVINSVMENYSSVAEFVLGDTKLTVLDQPTASNEAINPYNPFMEIAKWAFIGFILGLIPSGLYAFFVRKIKSEEDIERYLNVGCFGTLPAVALNKRDRELANCSILNKNVGFRYVEAMRSITSRCEKSFDKNECKVILVTSTQAGEGNSTFAMNLAYSLSKVQKKVMLIDGDLRKPSLRKMIQAEGRDFSMEDFLNKKIKGSEAIVNIPATRVLLMAPGKESKNPIECLNSDAMSEFIEESKEVVDYIIIDAPPCSGLSDVAVLAKYSDGIIYIVKEDCAKVNKILDTIQEFSYTRTPILGCVLNGTMGRLRLSYGYGYGYGRHYGYGRYGYGKYGYGKYGYGKKGYGYGYGHGYGYGYGYGEYGQVSDKEFQTKSRSVSKHISMETTEEQKKALEKERLENIDE